MLVVIIVRVIVMMIIILEERMVNIDDRMPKLVELQFLKSMSFQTPYQISLGSNLWNVQSSESSKV